MYTYEVDTSLPTVSSLTTEPMIAIAQQNT